MIKLKLTSEIISKHREYILNESNIASDLNKLINDGIMDSEKKAMRALEPEEKKFVNYMIKHVNKLKRKKECSDSIFLMNAEKLKDEIKDIENNYKSVYEGCLKKDDFSKALLNALGYTKFCEAKEGKNREIIKTNGSKEKVVLSWGAYRFTKELGLEVCPYCHMDGIKTYEDDEDSSRADLDHFRPKAKYPYLSMSIYNLIPSCQECNQRFKHEEDFDYSDHMNLYESAMHNKLVTFSYYAKSYDAFIGENGEDIDILLKSDSKIADSVRVMNNCKSLKIQGRYKNNTAEETVSKMLFDKRRYDKTERPYVDPAFFAGSDRKHILGSASDEKLLNMVYGKLQLDIYEELQNVTEKNAPKAVLDEYAKEFPGVSATVGA